MMAFDFEVIGYVMINSLRYFYFQLPNNIFISQI